MSDFLNYVSDDIFLFFDDFATIGTLGGKEMPLIDEGNTLTEMITTSGTKGARPEGIYRVNHLIYFKESDWNSTPPARGANIEYNGEQYLVDNVDNQNGILIVGLIRANEVML